MHFEASPMGLCRVLVEDPELAAAVPGPQRSRATEECVAGLLRLSTGAWNFQPGEAFDDGIGLLVLDGLLIRRVGIDGRYGGELLGEGDLLRPWLEADLPASLPHSANWRVLAPTRMAALDGRAAEAFARYPSLTGVLVGRALQRSRNLAVNMAIVNQPRTDVRLEMLFWHLAGRWGRVRSDGIALPLRLTHAVLADLVAARRPTVSTAVSELARRGAVTHDGTAWRLHHAPPGELLEVSPAPLAEQTLDR